MRKARTVARKILVIDDDMEIIMIMSDILRNSGYEVLAAQSGLEAIKNFNETKIDLILMDICMPVFSGLWFCHVFKNRTQTSDLPIVVVSALSGEEDIKKAYRLGASAYLKKPFRADELLATVERTLGQNA